jgi:hypothetical protein
MKISDTNITQSPNAEAGTRTGLREIPTKLGHQRQTSDVTIYLFVCYIIARSNPILPMAAFPESS